MDKYLYTPYLIIENTYSGRCNLGYDRLLQIHVEKKKTLLERTTFKGPLDRHQYAFFGGGAQDKTNISEFWRT